MPKPLKPLRDRPETPAAPTKPVQTPEPQQEQTDENAQLRAQLESMQKMMGQVLLHFSYELQSLCTKLTFVQI